MNEQNDKKSQAARVVGDHRRQWRSCRFVYPVVSRRAGGLSVGINLNLDKRCNYSCMYCQVNRRIHGEKNDIDINRLHDELVETLNAFKTGEIWNEGNFVHTPAEYRRLNDIAFSGDGEPTHITNFDQAVIAAVKALEDVGLKGCAKLVVITNATNLMARQVRNALSVLDANRGEFWCKLDAGTEHYFRTVNRPVPGLTLEKICENILSIAVGRPVVIQTLWFKIDGKSPSDMELEAYAGRLRWLVGCGGQIDHVQLHTIARPPSAANASAMPDAELDEIAKKIIALVPGVKFHVYYGQDVKPQ
ncbi:MAG TPA: radical SAM protein [Phycisphaerae bacterium]|nr:radical SAM protein [Phycisphaerae bacterium]HPS53517.1 radical SAM protein [Phycisphaerae bacterium]